MNPNSGKKRNIVKILEKWFENEKIDFEIYNTKGYMDAFQKVKSLNIADFSAIFASGGDGTIHEVVNGLMARPDSSKLPLGFIPNGSGNDTCWGQQIVSVADALSAFGKREVI